MNLGEVIRELEVEPVQLPAGLPATTTPAPAPTTTPTPEPVPA